MSAADITEVALARAIAFQILDSYHQGSEYFEVWSTTTEGNVIYAYGKDENDGHFEFACEVKFT